MFKHRLGTSFPSFNFWAFGWRYVIKWTYRFSSWTSLSEPGQSGSQQRSFFSPLNIRCEVFKDCVVHVFNASAKLMNERMIEGWKEKRKQTKRKKERNFYLFASNIRLSPNSCWLNSMVYSSFVIKIWYSSTIRHNIYRGIVPYSHL